MGEEAGLGGRRLTWGADPWGDPWGALALGEEAGNEGGGTTTPPRLALEEKQGNGPLVGGSQL